MKLSDVCVIKTNFPEADFWIARRGSVKTVGAVTREFSKYHIGIKVIETEILIPDYLYYVFMNFHHQGEWKNRAKGTLQLVHITVADVKNIRLTPM